jgi:hypothetical protein
MAKVFDTFFVSELLHFRSLGRVKELCVCFMPLQSEEILMSVGREHRLRVVEEATSSS